MGQLYAQSLYNVADLRKRPLVERTTPTAHSGARGHNKIVIHISRSVLCFVKTSTYGGTGGHAKPLERTDIQTHSTTQDQVYQILYEYAYTLM